MPLPVSGYLVAHPDEKVVPEAVVKQVKRRWDRLFIRQEMLEGSARLRLGKSEHQIAADRLLLIPRGRVRAITAGPVGVRY